MPQSESGAAAKHPYADAMDEDVAALFDRMSAAADLGVEIKILRTCLAQHSHDPGANQSRILEIMPLLIRAVQAQAKLGGGVTEIEQFLRDTAEATLRELETHHA